MFLRHAIALALLLSLTSAQVNPGSIDLFDIESRQENETSTFPPTSDPGLNETDVTTDTPTVSPGLGETGAPVASDVNDTDITLAPGTSMAPSMAPIIESDKPTMLPTPGCFSSLRDLDVVMLDLNANGQDFRQKVFILCPNTIFEIGFTRDLDTGDCCVDGDVPIFPFPNTLIQCGEDGKSSNNCVIARGQTQILSNFYDVPHENIEFRGITFVDATLSVATIADAGEYTFTDCIFKVSKHFL